MTQFFRFVHREKNESFWPKKIESLAEQKFDPNFWVKMTQFFRFVHREKKNESFWPKKIESLAEQKFDPIF